VSESVFGLAGGGWFDGDGDPAVVVTGELDHPNIVRAHDIDHDEKLHFIVLEFVDGANLEEIVHEKCILTSNTSGIPAQQIFGGMKHPERSTITHFFAPAWRSMAVEVINWDGASQELLNYLIWFFATTGKAPVVTSPNFFGSNPAVVRDGPKKGTRALRDEEDVARELMATFTPDQRTKIIYETKAPGEMLTAESRDVKPLPMVGVTAAEMTPPQRRALEKLLDVYLGRVAPELAKARLEALQKEGFDKINFGWAGVMEVGGPHYYRIQGPTFLVEYDNTQNDGNHVHSVWRDFTGDFGRDLLREHVKGVPH
jgi:hypothetical protein